MVSIVHCRECGKECSNLAAVELRDHSFCDQCNHTHTDIHRMEFCSLECLIKHVSDPEKQTDMQRELDAFKSNRLWQYQQDRRQSIKPESE